MSLSQNENPFFHRGPIRDRRYFFGRIGETRQALRMLRKDQCVSIVGPRRIGKTSLLFHLCDPEVQKEHNLGEKYLFVFINCEGRGGLDKSGFYQWIWREIKGALVDRGETDDWVESIADFPKFREMMQTIQEIGYRPILLFDEFEVLAQNSNLDHDLFSGLRSLVAQEDIAGDVLPALVIYVTASHNSLDDLTYADKSVLSSPFFNVFKPLHLGFLRPEEAKEMVLGSLRVGEQEGFFTEFDLDFVYKIGGHFPLFLQMACDHLFEQKNKRNDLTTADYEGVRQNYFEEALAHFRYIWNNLNVKEQNAVRLVAEGKSIQLDDEQRRQLERKCVLYEGAVFSSAFAEFVRRQESQLEVSESKFDASKTLVKLQVARLAGLEFEVRALRTPMGEPCANGRMPYDPVDLIAVLKVLELGRYDPDRFTSTQTEALYRLELLDNSHLVPNLLSRVGEGLYQALFPDHVRVAFQMAFNQARSRRETLALQLRFASDAVALAHYPWELLHDGQRHLLASSMVEMTRYITYAEAVTALPVAPPWQLLYISARPQDLDELLDGERTAVWESLQSLVNTGKLALDRLDPPTYEALLDQMAVTDYHIIHFDGHGVFARRCPECYTMHYPHIPICQSCSLPLSSVPPLGYLVFEDDARNVDYVSTEEMENLLFGSKIRLAVLSACQSGVVRGEPLFGRLAPDLIRAGVPAVVAMQFPMSVSDTVRFIQGFYLALVQGETMSRAVAQGRRRLFRRKTWFIPTLYLRSADERGDLFIEETATAASRGKFGNFEGFVLVEIVSGQGDLVPLSKKQSYDLSRGQTYQLRVTFQSQEPSNRIFDFIRFTGGQDMENVIFTIEPDCDTLRFEPNSLDFIVRSRQTEPVTRGFSLATDVDGEHTVFVQILQHDLFLQSVRVELEIQ